MQKTIELDWQDVSLDIEYPLPVLDGRYFVWIPDSGFGIAKYVVDYKRWFSESGGIIYPTHWAYIEVNPPA